MNTKLSAVIVLLMLAGVGYLAFFQEWDKSGRDDAAPRNVVFSGTYVCLPHLDTEGPQTEECALGIFTDEDEYYALDFNQAPQEMEKFQVGMRIRAEGFVVPKIALSTDYWQKYDMEGIFTILNVIEPSSEASGKIDIVAVCQGALAYMSFPDAAAAEVFVTECIEGKHPDVIESYKAQFEMDGAAI